MKRVKLYTKLNSFSNSNSELAHTYCIPFNPNTTLSYSLPKAEFVEIAVYNIHGQKIRTLVAEQKQSGQYRLNFNAASYASGIYYYQIHAGRFFDVKKMIVYL